MSWSLLAGAIPYLIAAAIGARLAWGVQSVRVDGLRADVAVEQSNTAKAAAERDNWREVAAECGAATLKLEAESKARIARATKAAKTATAELAAAESALAAWRAQRPADAAGGTESCDQVIARFQGVIR